LLDGLLTAALAWLAGAGSPAAGGRAVGLGLAMFCLQASIGTVNDIVDLERDRGAKPGKPLPRGLVGRPTASFVAALGLLAGLGLSALIEPRAAGVAVVGLGLGYAYDLRLKASRWSWLPFALGIGLLPVYAWLGATGSIPAVFGLLLPMATLAGASLALANQLADDERDRQVGLRTAVGSLGRARAWAVSALLDAVVGVGALASLVLSGAPFLFTGAADASIGLIVVGLHLGRSGLPATRERAWELQAGGFACLALAWLAGLANQGLLRA
jgi:4-hydroxybenzoate polyprenyltransferase